MAPHGNMATLIFHDRLTAAGPILKVSFTSLGFVFDGGTCRYTEINLEWYGKHWFHFKEMRI